jgi:hypothetical protein
MMDSESTTIGSAEIVASLKRLNLAAESPRPSHQFDRISLNHAVLTTLAGSLSRSDDDLSTLPFETRLLLTRGALASNSIVATNIRFLVWCRRCATAEHATQALSAFQGGSLITSATAIRSILELVGNTALLEKKIGLLSEGGEDENALIEWIHNVEDVVDESLLGVRIDYRTLADRGLRSNKKNAYKPLAHEKSLEAKDLLNGVDHLGKVVLGARNAYDFLSEFTHPNLISVWTHYDVITPNMSIGDLHMYSVRHQAGSVGEEFLKQFGPILIEAIDIAIDSINHLQKISVDLNERANMLDAKVRRVIRKAIKKNPQFFNRTESCPCHSGKVIRYCCGKLVNERKFGELSSLGVKFW